MARLMDNPDDRPITFHVGYHKTGTTWFQLRFFQKNMGFSNLLSEDEVAQMITNPRRFDFDASHAREAIANRRPERGVAAIISNEILCGHPFFGGREGPEYADRIKAIAPRAKILFTIREQIGMISSTYAQYVSRGGSLSIAEFLSRPGGYNFFYFDKQHFYYDDLIGYYKSLFGLPNVMVVTVESLKREPVKTLLSIAAFAGAHPSRASLPDPLSRVGESPAEAVLPLLRRLNHFRKGPAKREVVIDGGSVVDVLYRAVAKLGRAKGAKAYLKNHTPIRNEVARRFRGEFAESNRRLQEMFGSRIDLKIDGYQLSPRVASAHTNEAGAIA